MNQLKVFAARMKRHLMTLYFAAQHPELPLFVKFLAFFIIGYALSPLDLIPDFIPILGLLDDLILLPIGIYICYRLVPGHILQEARSQTGEIETRHQYAIALVIVLLWVLFIYLVGWSLNIRFFNQ